MWILGFLILAVILLLLILLLLLRLRFDIVCAEDVVLSLRILFLRIPLYPAAPKNVKVSKFKRGYPKEKAEEKPAEKKAKKQTAPAEKIPLGEKINIVLSLVKKLCKKFFRHLRLDVSHIVITVGADDAAGAAITYGIVSQSVAYLLAFLDAHLNIRKKRRGEIAVRCDFTADHTVCDICITASLAVWQLLDIGISFAYNYFKSKDIFNLKKS